MATLKLSPPWVIFYRKVCAMFEYDKDVHVIYDEEENEIKLYVDDDTKAEALTRLLPTTHEFGNITVKMSVVPANCEAVNLEEVETDYATLFDLAFDGNGVYSFSNEILVPFSKNSLTFIVFRKQVVQFWTDNLSDYYGYTSTLYQDIARDIFGEIPNVYYSTDREDPVYALKKPLEEWP